MSGFQKTEYYGKMYEFLSEAVKAGQENSGFVKSLVASYGLPHGKGWTQKQAHYAQKAAIKLGLVVAPESFIQLPGISTIPVGGFTPDQPVMLVAEKKRHSPSEPVIVGPIGKVLELFNTAGTKLKHPQIEFSGGDGSIRASLSKNDPKRLLLLSSATWVPVGSRFFGYMEDGMFRISAHMRRNGGKVPEIVMKSLYQFVCDPGGTVADHGRKTGRCGFCFKALTDPISVSVGYGKTCATNYGLPWNKKVNSS